jgi:hypothetical protein
MRFGGFVALVLAIALGGYAALLAAGRTPVYCSYSQSFFDTAPCFTPETRGVAVETLLVGDSSLLYGISPELVEQAGGGTTYNLGMVGPSFAYLAPWLIDRYLANNARPKTIILYFAPWDVIDEHRIVDPQWAPVGFTLLRHGSPADLARLVATRPSALVELPPLIWNGLGTSRARADADRDALRQQRGHLDYATRGLPPLSADCQAGSLPDPPFPVTADNRVAIERLKARYRARGIAVFAYIAPWAECDGHVEQVRRAYAGVADTVPGTLPNTVFAADAPFANHVHASAAGVPVLSERLAAFIRTVVNKAPAA